MNVPAGSHPHQSPRDDVRRLAAEAADHAQDHLTARGPLKDPDAARAYLSGAAGAHMQQQALLHLGHEFMPHIEAMAEHLRSASSSGMSFAGFCLGRAALVFATELVDPGDTLDNHDVHALRSASGATLRRPTADVALWPAGIRAASATDATVLSVYQDPVAVRAAARASGARAARSSTAALDVLAGGDGSVLPLPPNGDNIPTTVAEHLRLIAQREQKGQGKVPKPAIGGHPWPTANISSGMLRKRPR